VKHPAADSDHLRDTGLYRADAKRPLGLQCRRRHASSKVTTVFKPFCPVLAIQDPSEVSPLSGRAKIEPLSGPLQIGIRFFRHPIPTRPRARSRGRPSTFLWERMGLPRSTRVPVQKDVGSALPPAVQHLRGEISRPSDLTAYLLVHAYQPLWHVASHDGSTAVHMC
jgi:hypothetical protein